jgi:hypothetical protein
MSAVIGTATSRAWEEKFDRAFGKKLNGQAITPMKKLDFLIWAGAPRKIKPERVART